MNIWFRTPSLKWMAKARFSPRRFFAHNVGFKTPYWATTNMKKQNYNKIYHKTTFSLKWLITSLFR